jgi:alkanesulfonate monooxygenase SsuD/methylene tetrahydromethanopterin reductase-like flavin-dependent oxidoreductase (luciferase family)
MDFGIFTMFTVRENGAQSEAFQEWFGIVQAAEDLGLDTFWIGESHFRPERAVMAAPLIGASAVAARTKRIKVGLAVQVLPLANPLRIAEEAAIVDHISEGRLVFGVGRSSFIESYQGYNIDYTESRGRFTESLEVILKAWGDEPFSYEGEFYQFHDVDLVPKTYQKPHPKVRVAVESKDTFALTGSLGYPIFMRHQMEISQLQELLHQYQDARHLAGFAGPNDVILQVGAYVAETAEQAYLDPQASTMHRVRVIQQNLNQVGDQETYERLKRSSEVTYDELLPRMAFGTPEAVAEKIQQYREYLGITGISVDVNPGGQIPHEKVMNSMRLLSEEVMPLFR